MSKKQNYFINLKIVFYIFLAILSCTYIFSHEKMWISTRNISSTNNEIFQELNKLEVKDKDPKINYKRENFGKGWQIDENGCNTRNRILKRDLKDTTEDKACKIITGKLLDPYTNEEKYFDKNKDASSVQIDHVVALSDAWQKGAQKISLEKRIELANDPLNLLAVDGAKNKQKGDSDASQWLPPNKKFQCQYISRQVKVKYKYALWVTAAEKEAMNRVLSTCEN